MIENEAREPGRGKIIQHLKSQSQDFGFYSKSDRQPVVVLSRQVTEFELCF